MTARELIAAAGRHPEMLVPLALLPPLLSLLLPLAHGAGGGARSPWRYVYSVLIYAVCVPGVGAAVLTAYTLFFTRESLLDKDLLVYLLPIVSLAVTLPLIRRSVSFDAVPGFDRLWGLLVLIAITFGILLAIHKTFIGIFFGGSFTLLVALGVAVFALLERAAGALGGGPRH